MFCISFKVIDLEGVKEGERVSPLRTQSPQSKCVGWETAGRGKQVPHPFGRRTGFGMTPAQPKRAERAPPLHDFGEGDGAGVGVGGIGVGFVGGSGACGSEEGVG